MTTSTSRPGFLGQARVIARRDLTRESREGEVFWVTLPFAGIALLLVPLAVGTDSELIHSIGPGIFWVIALLFGVLISVRQTNADTQPQRDLVALIGFDPVAIFSGTAFASFLLLLVFEVVLGGVAIVLYDITLVGSFVLPVVVVLVGAGLSLLGTIASGLVANSKSATALVPLIVAPMSVPLLLGATQSLEAIRLGSSSLAWVVLMMIVVLVLAVIGVLSARTLQEIS